MAGILRVVDDRLWETVRNEGAAIWRNDEDESFAPMRLVQHLVPVKVAMDRVETREGEVCRVTVRKGSIRQPTDTALADLAVGKLWEQLLEDKDHQRDGVPLRVIFLGALGGKVQRRVSTRALLKTGQQVSFNALPAWVPEIVRVRVGHPVFLEIQLLTGAAVAWIREGLGPVENPVFGGEWDVLCLDKRGQDDSAPDFHQQWLDWYQQQGLAQAFRTVLLFSSRDTETASAHEDAFLSPSILERLPAHPQRCADLGASLEQTMAHAREVLAWRTQDEGDEDELVLPAAMAEQWKAARIAAELDGGVLVVGLSGTGKSAMARLIHRWSGRAPARFVYANCGAMASKDLAKDELFGHVKGAFTGADNPKLGLLTLANRGTLFLDEVHRLPVDAQNLLLDVLDRQKFLPMGTMQLEHVDLRVVCGSNEPYLQQPGGPLAQDLRNRLFHTVLELPSAADYGPDDFHRLVDACWDKVSDATDELFGVNRGSTLRKYHPNESFKEQQQLYDRDVPARGLFASDRLRARLEGLRLSDEALDYLFGAREQLRKSNARGLIAWLRRAMLRCSADGNVVTSSVLMECSPEALGLVSEEMSVRAAALDESALAQELFRELHPKSGTVLNFTRSLSRIQAKLGQLRVQNQFNVHEDELAEFLLNAFDLLRRQFEREGVSWEQPNRQPKLRRAFYVPRWAFTKLLTAAALPAFGIHKGDQAPHLRRADAWINANGRERAGESGG